MCSDLGPEIDRLEQLSKDLGIAHLIGRADIEDHLRIRGPGDENDGALEQEEAWLLKRREEHAGMDLCPQEIAAWRQQHEDAMRAAWCEDSDNHCF